MHAIILAATHDRGLTFDGRDVPRPLLDLGDEPLLTALVRRLAELSSMERIVIVTNEAIKSELDGWADAELSACPVPVEIISDGTLTKDEAKGGLGDLLFAVRQSPIESDLLVVGGDNWFTYDMEEFLQQARGRTPAVVVTPFRAGWRSSRFGVVEMDENGQIVKFQERPASSTLSLKASCVYYFSYADLKWLEAFAQEQSTVCTPGTLFAWLVGRVPVYGVKITATWYDVGRHSGQALDGPDFLELRKVLRKLVSPLYSTWEREAARQLQWASSLEDVLGFLDDPDPNRRIVAIQILGNAVHLLAPDMQLRVVEELLRLLSDPSMNQIAYAGFQEDDDSVCYVSSAAAEALTRLGYASTTHDVFEKARVDGAKVAKR